MRKRTFYYGWCNITEVDYVCERCETISLDGGKSCHWCTRNHAIPTVDTEGKKVNVGLLRMQELNRQRAAEKKARNV